MSDNPVKTYLAEHPKACGAVFMMTMLLASASNAAATVSAVNGP
ncbi:DUF7503 family protein [Halorarum halophilum]|nr:hypothetical protein [Halobaculum halophilum]